MATRRIDTTIALDGEQAFKQGLASAAREMRVLESESRALAASFASSGDAAAAAAAKQRNLQNQVSQQEQIVSALERAVRDAAQAYGEGSAEVDGYAIKLNNARTRLANLQKALDSADREVEELGRDSQKAGQQISKGIGEGAQEAEKDVRSLMETMQESLDSIQSNTGVVAIKTAWDMAKGAYSSIEGFVSGTVDYRRQLSYLLQNSETVGLGLEQTEELMVKTQAVTADASAAIEGLSNLFRIEGIDEYSLNRIMTNLFGASVRWPETMKFETLAESLQETLATGGAAGQYAELLSRIGVDVEKFNTALEKSPTSLGDLETAVAYLENKELAAAYEKYKADNEELIKELETIARLEFQSSRIGGILARNVTTPLKSEWANALDWIADSLETWEKEGAEAAWEQAKASLRKNNPEAADVTDSVEGALEWINNNLNPIKAFENAEKALKGERSIKETLDSLNLFSEKYYSDEQKERIASINAAKEAYEERQKVIQAYKQTEESKTEGQKTGAAYAEGFAEGFDITLDLTNVEAKEAMPLRKIGEKSMAHVLENIDLEAYYAEMEKAGEEGGEKLTEGFETGAGGGDAAALAAGSSAGAAYAQGLLSQVSYVSSAAASLAAAAAARMQGGLTGATGMVSGVLNIDGRAAGTFLAPYVSEKMAVMVE